SNPDAEYDDVVTFQAEDIAPTVTWGINPGQAIFIDERIPTVEGSPEHERESVAEALEHMKLHPGAPIKGTPIDVAFLGSCTNGRLSDLVEVSKNLRGRHVNPGVKAIVVPGSQGVAA